LTDQLSSYAGGCDTDGDRRLAAAICLCEPPRESGLEAVADARMSEDVARSYRVPLQLSA
jgi:hypothetical protein